jgi:hypothetical protein
MAARRDARFIERPCDWTQRCAGSGCAHLLRLDRELKNGEQAGRIVLENQLALVEMGDGFGQCEAKTGAFVRSA